jgi:hypothetical protein
VKASFISAAGLIVALGCSANRTEPEAYPGFSGTWSGGQSSGAQMNGTIRFIVTGVDIAGEVSPISGSQREFTGDIQDGAILAVVPAAPGGCVVTLYGSIGFANDGTGAGSASGTYVLRQSGTCNANNGTWSATKPPHEE